MPAATSDALAVAARSVMISSLTEVPPSVSAASDAAPPASIRHTCFSAGTWSRRPAAPRPAPPRPPRLDPPHVLQRWDLVAEAVDDLLVGGRLDEAGPHA